MTFSSFTFLCYFLPLTLAGYFILPFLRWRNLFLLGASLIFYAWYDVKYLFWLIDVIIISYLTTTLMEGCRPKIKLLFLILGVLGILSGLFYFKYFFFAATLIGQITNSEWVVSQIIMPIGISFYTFRAFLTCWTFIAVGRHRKTFLTWLYISVCSPN